MHTGLEDYYRDVAHPPGMGLGGWGAGAVHPLPFPERAAVTRYDDMNGSRPAARPALGHMNGGQLQLRNGVADVAHLRLHAPVSMYDAQKVRVNRMVLPGDRAIVPPSTAQVQGWQADTAGAQPREVTGNGSVVGAWPVGGGAY